MVIIIECLVIRICYEKADFGKVFETRLFVIAHSFNDFILGNLREYIKMARNIRVGIINGDKHNLKFFLTNT